MRFRIGQYDEKYWVEARIRFRWRRLPSLEHWDNWKNLRFYPEYVEYFGTYDDARKLAAEYIARYQRSAPVYVEVRP